jgi:hypothetical protein
VTLEQGTGRHRKYLPNAFTEQGVAMLSAVLRSDVAVKISVQIIQAFVLMRKTMGQLQGMIQRLEGIELKQLQSDNKLELLFRTLLKDLGTKCFSFNQMNDLLTDFKSLFFKIGKNE